MVFNKALIETITLCGFKQWNSLKHVYKLTQRNVPIEKINSVEKRWFARFLASIHTAWKIIESQILQVQVTLGTMHFTF